MVSKQKYVLFLVRVREDFLGGSAVKNPPVSIPGSGKSPGEGNGNPFHCSHLGNPMDRRA